MQVQVIAEEWLQDYNCNRPHEALEGKTQIEYNNILPAAYCHSTNFKNS